MNKTVNGLVLEELCEIFKNVNENHSYKLRGSSTKLHIARAKKEFLKNSIGYK